MSCAAPIGGASLEGVDLRGQAVIRGIVVADGKPVPDAYVRLLDEGGDFAAEVPTAADGEFRFFAVSGRWIVRALAPRRPPAEQPVLAVLGQVTQIQVSLGSL